MPHRRRPRPNSLVEANSHSVHRVDFAVKRSLEVTVRTKTFLDKPTPTSLRPQRKALEPLDVLVIEEHVAHSDDPFVDLIWVASKDYTLRNDTVQRWRK